MVKGVTIGALASTEGNEYMMAEGEGVTIGALASTVGNEYMMAEGERMS